MPSSIPYDPSLTLCSVVSEAALKVVEDIAAAQAPVDAAQLALNSLISSKRSLDFTRTEITNLGVDTTSLSAEIKKINDSLGAAAASYAAAKVTAEPQIQKLREQIRGVHAQVESPVDYVKTEIKSLPLAADTMNMDVQYFTLDSNSQDSNSYAATISSYVGASSSEIWGPDLSSKLSSAAQTQVSNQVSKHKIIGTVVVSVTCTHKNASVLAPFVINVDKGIKVWNRLFPDKKLDPTMGAQMAKLATSDTGKEKFSIISGTTFGSSFVGMVHILNTTDTTASDSLKSAAESLQAKMTEGCWFANASGEFGANSSFSNDVKTLLSSQDITSHVTLLSMGVIPSMKANDVANAVVQFSKFDPASNIDAVAKIQNATAADQDSIQSSADAARTSQSVVSMKSSTITAALGALEPIESNKNKVLDVNSMMTALDDYLEKAANLTSGVPINYYLKDIDIKMLAEMWVAKYYPGKYMSIKYDDTEGGGPAEKAKL